jgi:RNA polymerase sigma-70 factor (ECF subfamily)
MVKVVALQPRSKRAEPPAPARRAEPARAPERVFDELLVSLAQDGDRAALERLAQRWRPRHYAHARRLLRSPDAAADAVQEAWVGIVRGIGRLRDVEQFPSWSYAIVTRRCRDAQRLAARAPSLDAEIEPADPNPADPGAAHDLKRALAALPPVQRAAVALYYREGFTAAEIGRALGVPLGTVKTRLFHARRALRRSLRGETP